MERKITFKAGPLTLVGRNLKVGNIAPEFNVVSQDLAAVRLSDLGAKIKVISSFPSLDTPVCDLQVKEFNKRAAGFSDEVVVIGISKDLPFAQKRFCQENSIKNETVLSDYKSSSFAINYGLLIKELNLLARSVLIIDKNNILRYFKIVGELTSPPDYSDALKNLEEVIKIPLQAASRPALPARCKPCEIGTPPLSEEKIEKLIAGCPGWELVEGKKITRELKFKDFAEAKYFLDIVALIAEEQGHHPALAIIYNKLKITLTTHASGGLTENDFIMAGMINELEG
ncbi:MAG: thiol peroxidase [Candidatus Omnitrophota bacterium]